MVCLRGVAFVKRKAVRVSARTGDRLTRFLFDRSAPPSSQDMTIVITGVTEENLFSADLFMGSQDMGTVISVSALHKDINRLLVGVLGGPMPLSGVTFSFLCRRKRDHEHGGQARILCSEKGARKAPSTLHVFFYLLPFGILPVASWPRYGKGFIEP